MINHYDTTGRMPIKKERDTVSRSRTLPTLFDRLTDLEPRKKHEVQRNQSISHRALK